MPYAVLVGADYGVGGAFQAVANVSFCNNFEGAAANVDRAASECTITVGSTSIPRSYIVPGRTILTVEGNRNGRIIRAGGQDRTGAVCSSAAEGQTCSNVCGVAIAGRNCVFLRKDSYSYGKEQGEDQGKEYQSLELIVFHS